ncbi:transglycosylase domain-containing protein, partial [Actinomadura kijaniata]|uniref:transglycosylase domain-containing protein n=1 Tax=Actinomadura kijaniata TaxID=46161 RepID=UPI003F1BC913
GGGGDGRKRRREGWRRFVPSWKVTAGVIAVMVLAAFVLVFVGYSMTPVPDDRAAQDGVLAQGSVITYNDGKTPIMRLGVKRQSVSLDKVPQHVRDAVVAAEDREFYTSNLGVSPKGMVRALLKAATGESVEGGSTITQQLARNYYKGLSQDRTMSRKFKEIFIASKLGQSKKKEQILEMYLNTIPFGRQSLGIQMAARSYFHKDVGKLTVAEGAMLAAMIQQPGYFQTQGNSEANQALRNRWNYVLDGMVKMGKLDQAKRATMQFPSTKSDWSDVDQDPQAIYIRDRITFELNKIDPELYKAVQLGGGGVTIQTSLDPKIMQYAIDAMKEQGVRSWPKHIGTGLIAVDSSSGEILGFYGGNPKRNQLASVFSAGAQVGSSFKPYVLAAALKQGHSVKSTISGKSPMCFSASGEAIPGSGCGGYTVKNDEGDPPFDVIDLVKATEKSVNTSYVKLGLEVGLDNVIKTAQEFGVPKRDLEPHKGAAGLSLGIANIAPVYQAAGYAAFANGGVFHEPHLIKKVTKYDPVKKETKQVDLPWKTDRVLNNEQAAQANYAMRSVVTTGTGTAARLPDRQVAGKTGTAEKNSAAWFVGYIPQVSAAVSMYNTKGVKPISGIPGFPQTRSVYGGTVPAKIWKSFMQKVIAYKQLEPKPFAPPTFSGLTSHQWDAPAPPKPTKTPTTPSQTPSCQPTEPGSGNGNGNGQQPPDCQPTEPTEEPSEPTSPPPSGEKPPCTISPNVPVGCDPSKQPPTGTPEHQQWCGWHRQHPSCKKDPDGPETQSYRPQSRPSGEGV